MALCILECYSSSHENSDVLEGGWSAFVTPILHVSWFLLPYIQYMEQTMQLLVFAALLPFKESVNHNPIQITFNYFKYM